MRVETVPGGSEGRDVDASRPKEEGWMGEGRGTARLEQLVNWEVGSDGGWEGCSAQFHPPWGPRGEPGPEIAPATRFFMGLSWKETSWGQALLSQAGSRLHLVADAVSLVPDGGHSSLSGVGVTRCKEFWDQEPALGTALSLSPQSREGL